MVTVYSHIVNFILLLQLSLSKPQRNHLLSIMHGIVLCDGRKTITAMRRQTKTNRDLSCMTRFLSESPWNHHTINRQRRRFLQQLVRREQKKCPDKQLVFLLVDDTGCMKNATTRKMERLDFHFLHAEGKTVWSHVLVTSHVVTGNISAAYDFRPYFREEACTELGIGFKSKIDLAIELVQDFNVSDDERVYVLFDSWYASKKLIDACNAKGFHVIAAFKTNRMMYPAGIQVKVSDFAQQYIRHTDLRSVTVGDHRYRVYEYEGQLSDIENVEVLLCWEDGFSPEKTPFCILCTDGALDVVTILRHYLVRWNIETGYRYFKDLLGFDQYQMQSYQAIERFWTIQYLVYAYLEFQRLQWTKEDAMTLGDVVRRIRNEYLGNIVCYVYQQALENRPLLKVLNTLHLIA